MSQSVNSRHLQPIMVVKLVHRRREKSLQLLKVADRVLFDHRIGWLLVSPHIGARPRKQEFAWVHVGDVNIEWIRTFNFREVADGACNQT